MLLLNCCSRLPSCRDRSFIEVGIPIQTGCVGESYFQTDARLNQLGNL